MAAGAALFVKEIVKEAAKDTWRNRGKILSSVTSVGNHVKQLAVAIANLRTRLSSRTSIEIGMPYPDDYGSTTIELQGSDPDVLAIQIALFVHYLPALRELIRDEKLDRRTVAAGIQLKILDDASLEVWWQDMTTLERRTRTLSLVSRV